MMKRNIVLILLILASLQVCAQDSQKKMRYTGYAGGMMLNSGYLFGGKYDLNGASKTIQGVPFGIGGVMKLCFGKHLRVGFEGYTSSLAYDSNKSSVSLGWGGVLADCKWELGKVTLFAGASFGGGRYKHIINTETKDAEYNEDLFLYRSIPVLVGVPFIGIEYAISTRLHLSAKVDTTIYLNKNESDFVKGPRLYLGFLFCRQK